MGIHFTLMEKWKLVDFQVMGPDFQLQDKHFFLFLINGKGFSINGKYAYFPLMGK